MVTYYEQDYLKCSADDVFPFLLSLLILLKNISSCHIENKVSFWVLRITKFL